MGSVVHRVGCGKHIFMETGSDVDVWVVDPRDFLHKTNIWLWEHTKPATYGNSLFAITLVSFLTRKRKKKKF